MNNFVDPCLLACGGPSVSTVMFYWCDDVNAVFDGYEDDCGDRGTDTATLRTSRSGCSSCLGSGVSADSKFTGCCLLGCCYKTLKAGSKRRPPRISCSLSLIPVWGPVLSRKLHRRRGFVDTLCSGHISLQAWQTRCSVVPSAPLHWGQSPSVWCDVNRPPATANQQQRMTWIQPADSYYDYY